MRVRESHGGKFMPYQKKTSRFFKSVGRIMPSCFSLLQYITTRSKSSVTAAGLLAPLLPNELPTKSKEIVREKSCLSISMLSITTTI
ncbi:hypothetical protein CABS02_13788 [Colletotrichum abscissum]|uniref:Uncharacterized protein n=1 Tax=Colletotrichum abscissum TaxID=1671311 RepID=A0A9P9X2G7_9PEZI|nr:hypothetical protein CABS02_13788 [Colletotrichum abscissum]